MDENTRTDNGCTTQLEPGFNAYIGTKLLLARPMSENEWLKDRNQESMGRDGFLVVYDNGYRSWSPKDVFETHYRLLTQLEKRVAITKT